MSSDMIAGVMNAADPRRVSQAQSNLQFVNINDQSKIRRKEEEAGLFAKLAEKLGLTKGTAAASASSPSAARAMESIGGRDLIADVMGAADPQNVQKAVARLRSVGGAPDTAVARNDAAPGAADAPNDADSARGKAMQKLEGVLLSNVLENMMPKSESDLYGGGTAGDMWRGFQVNQLAEAMAERGVLDLEKLGNGPRQQKATATSSGQWPYFQSRPISSFSS